jgi:exopolysaccharide biosynthesis polyprenyl glycosylphosphotransferase
MTSSQLAPGRNATPMHRPQSNLLRSLLAAGDLLAAFLAFFAALRSSSWVAEWLGRERLQPTAAPLGDSALITLLGSAVLALWIFYRWFGIYRSHRVEHFSREAGGILLANGLTMLVLLAEVAGFRLEQPSRLQIGLFGAYNSALVLFVHGAGRLYLKRQRRAGKNTRYVMLVSSAQGRLWSFVRRVRSNLWWGYRVIGTVDMPGQEGLMEPGVDPLVTREGAPMPRYCLDEAAEVLDNQPVDEVWIDGFPGEDSPVRAFAESAAERGLMVRYILSEHHTPGSRWGFELLGGIEAISATTAPVDELSLIAKRLMDFIGSLIGLLLFLPAILIACVMIKLEDNGPILFRQERVGLNGRRFKILKFRSMVVDAERRLEELKRHNEMSGPVFKMSNDPRITPFGRWMRKLSIDEVPQLWNVLRGDMSLVGPRPPLPTEVDLYSPDQRRRLSVKPGITGLWQVQGRSNIQDFKDWVKLDLEYIDRWSLGLDVVILMRTIPAVLASKGAR